MAQAKRMMEKMQAEGSMPELQKMAGALGGAMGGGTGGGMGGMGAQSELERLRAENAALRAARGMRDEL